MSGAFHGNQARAGSRACPGAAYERSDAHELPIGTSPSNRKDRHMTDNTTAANKALLRRFYKEVYVDWNMALANEVLSLRFTSHDWPDGQTGPQAFRDYYAAIRSAVPDARYEVDDLIAEGDRVVVRWRLLGTHMGD